jgi:hypothetical protein
MALVSEGLIQRAYGAIDLSKFYDAIDSYSKQVAAQAKAQKAADLKEYNTNIANLTKEQSSGIRSIDIPKAVEYYNQFANAAKKQMSDRNMATNNPDLYSKLEKEKAEYLGKHQALVAGSKEKKKSSIDFTNLVTNPATKSDYRPNALQDWQKNVDNTPYEDIVKNGSDEYSKYYRTDVDESKFEDKLTANRKDAFDRLPIPIRSKEGGKDMIQINEYDKFPKIDKMFEAVTSSIGSAYGKLGSEARSQFIKQKAKSLNIEDITKRWNNLSDAEHIKRFGTPKPILTKEVIEGPTGKTKTSWGNSQEEEVVKLITADEYLRNLPTNYSKIGKKDFDSPTGAIDYRSQKSFDNSMRLFDAKYKKLQLSNTNFDASNVFSNISKGGKQGYATAESFVNYLNENPILGSTANMISTATLGDNSSVFKKSDDIINEAIPGVFDKGKPSFKGNNPDDIEKNKEIAAKLSDVNLQNGLTNVKVSPESLRSGKVISFNYIPAGKDKATTIFLDTQDPESVRYFNKTVRGAIESKKQIAAQAAGLTSMGGNDRLGLF